MNSVGNGAGYFLGFFWWLDLIAAASLLLDIEAVRQVRAPHNMDYLPDSSNHLGSWLNVIPAHQMALNTLDRVPSGRIRPAR